uniref:Ig-like domain-containing protein n=1 Tax=Sparus aurata TaxID=8175 RepID=A0A671TN56_SPAAU
YILYVGAVLTLQPNWTEVYRGETITLRCEIKDGGDTEWEYEWRTTSSKKPSDQNEHSISSVTESHSGDYRCKGRKKHTQHSSTDWSDSIKLTVSDVPVKAVVIPQPNWTEVYVGERITLRCEIKDGGDTEWEYEWRTTSSKKPSDQNEHSITSVTESHSGYYRCKGRKKHTQHSSTDWSDSIKLTVSDDPLPVLTVSPSWLSAGASVTLNCSVKDPSAGWRFYWYKRTHTAGYMCRAGRGDPVFYSSYSTPNFAWSAVPNKAVVTLQPNWSEVYVGERITLRCEIKDGGDTEWEYEWRTSSSEKPSDQNEHSISSVTESHSGDYRCKGRKKHTQHSSTDWSDPIKLTVSDSKSHHISFSEDYTYLYQNTELCYNENKAKDSLNGGLFYMKISVLCLTSYHMLFFRYSLISISHSES